MREEHHLRTWQDFVRRIAAIQRSVQRELLFRGHGDARWSLQTTLERRGLTDMPLDDYYRLMATRVKPQVESSTGRQFDVPSYPDLRELFRDYDEFSRNKFPTEVCSYLIYARHHGFPSPLLDWTRSPFVAAFFAFAAEHRGVKTRSIYAWFRPRVHVRGTNRPELHQIGRFLRTHQRHALQQCDYSFRATFDTSSREWRFTPHDEAFGGAEVMTSEHLIKFTLPSTERSKVLAFLDSFNLNAYSLFGSEESLMETIAIREIDLPGWNAQQTGAKRKSGRRRR